MKEARHRRVHNLWCHLHKVLIQAKWIYSDKNQISAWMHWDMGLTAKWQKELSVGMQMLYILNGVLARELYICQNSTVYFKCVHIIVCKLYLNKAIFFKRQNKHRMLSMELYSKCNKLPNDPIFLCPLRGELLHPWVWGNHVTCFFAQWNISNMWHN